MLPDFYIKTTIPIRRKVCFHVRGMVAKDRFLAWLRNQNITEIEVHPYDYTLSADVEFISRTTHPQLYCEVIDEIVSPTDGREFIKAKSYILTTDDIKKIKNLYDLGKYTNEEISFKCNILEETVVSVIRGETVKIATAKENKRRKTDSTKYNVIRDLLELGEHSQREIAEICDVDLGMVSRINTGKFTIKDEEE